MRRVLLGFVCAIVVVAGTQHAAAIGRVYARWPNNTSSPIYNLRIKTLTATVDVRDQLAVTHVDQVFANDNSFRLEGFYVFKLPEGAQVNELYLWINGVRTPYTVKKLEDAKVIYQEIVNKTADPAILEQLGTNLFKLRIFPFNANDTRRIEIVYSQPLTYFTGTIQYTFPLDMTDYTSAPIEQASLSIDVSSQLPITTVTTSADQFPASVIVTKKDSHHYTVVYGVENVTFQKDFKLRCEIDRGQSTLIGLTYNPPDTTEDPYFLLWHAVPDSLTSDSGGTRELTFVADVSSSMEGQRLQQTRDALMAFIGMLSARDRFNIISFSTGVSAFRPDLVQATPAAIDSARLFVGTLTALGLTNFEAALKTALQQAYLTDSLHAAVVFLTDGQPSWGETRTDSLLARTRRWNTQGVSLFPIGVGSEPDYTLLQGLAKNNHGLFTPIAADDSIYSTVKGLYRMVFLPKLRNITLDFGSLAAYDVFPSPIPDTYAGDQVLSTGRFKTFGVHHIIMNGTVGGEQRSYSSTIAFPDTDHLSLAIARYWGSQKIRNLLDLIAIVGEHKELVDQVISLSIQYSVLTPYTAFLIVEPVNNTGTSVSQANGIPRQLALSCNYPNPFNPQTTIRYTVPSAQKIRLAIYDVLGRLVAVLVDETKEPGEYSVQFNGAGLSSGVYFARLEAGPSAIVRQIVLMK